MDSIFLPASRLVAVTRRTAVSATAAALSGMAFAADVPAIGTDLHAYFGVIGLERAVVYLALALLGLGLFEMVARTVLGLLLATLAWFALPFTQVTVFADEHFVTVATGAVALMFTLPNLFRLLRSPVAIVLLVALVGGPVAWASIGLLHVPRWLGICDGLVAMVLLPALIARAVSVVVSALVGVLRAHPELLRAALLADTRIVLQLAADDPKSLAALLIHAPDALLRAVSSSRTFIDTVTSDPTIRSEISRNPNVWAAAVKADPSILEMAAAVPAFVDHISRDAAAVAAAIQKSPSILERLATNKKFVDRIMEYPPAIVAAMRANPADFAAMSANSVLAQEIAREIRKCPSAVAAVALQRPSLLSEIGADPGFVREVRKQLDDMTTSAARKLSDEIFHRKIHSFDNGPMVAGSSVVSR